MGIVTMSDIDYEALEKEVPLDDIDFSDLEEQYAVKPDFGIDNFVVVDGAPIAPEAKVPVLIGF